MSELKKENLKILRCGDTIRLTKNVRNTLINLTGEDPKVTNVQGLNNFIDYHAQNLGNLPEEKVIKHLLTAFKEVI